MTGKILHKFNKGRICYLYILRVKIGLYIELMRKYLLIKIIAAVKSENELMRINI